MKAPTMIINNMNNTKINAALLILPHPWFIKPLLFITHFILWLNLLFCEYFIVILFFTSYNNICTYKGGYYEKENFINHINGSFTMWMW